MTAVFNAMRRIDGCPQLLENVYSQKGTCIDFWTKYGDMLLRGKDQGVRTEGVDNESL